MPGLMSHDGVRRTALIAAVGCGLIWPACGSAQPTQMPAAASAAVIGPAPRQSVQASVGHVFTKTLTLNMGIAATGMAIYTLGTGSLADGSVLTAGAMFMGFTVYPANEYLWDRFSPNTNVKSNNEAFDTSASLWRTTYKYLTFKVAATVSKFSILYLYTGSLTSTLVMGTAASVVFPAVLYVNNVGWDWYDWSTSAAEKHG